MGMQAAVDLVRAKSGLAVVVMCTRNGVTCPCRLCSIFICSLDGVGWDNQCLHMLLMHEDISCVLFSYTKAACRERTVICAVTV